MSYIYSATDSLVKTDPLSVRSAHLREGKLEEQLNAIKACQNLEKLFVYNVKDQIVPDILLHFKKLKEVSFNNCVFSDIPSQIGELSELKNLTLEASKLKVLPESFFQLPLQNLSLKAPVENLSKNLEKMFHLIEASFQNTVLEELNFENVRFPHLQSLNITSSGLKKIILGTDTLPSLLTLEIVNNPIASLPSDFGKLKALHSLNIVGSNLQTLPSSIVELSKLKFLNISIGKLKELPEEMGKLTGLVHLHCQGNQLTTIPKSMEALQSLKSLNIGRNPLGILPEPIANLRSLEALEVEGAKLDELPDWIGQLSNLCVLNLTQNNLATLPDTFSQLSKVVHLVLDRNAFQELPASLTLDKLSLLSIKYNPLKTFEGLSKLPSLRTVSLASVPKEADLFGLVTQNRVYFQDGKQVLGFRCTQNQFEQLTSSLGKANISEESKRWFFHEVSKRRDIEKIPDTGKNRTLEGLSVPYKPLQTVMMKRLSAIIEAENARESLSKSSVITVMGRTTLKKTEIREKLKEIGVKYSSKLTDKVTHIVVGASPKEITQYEGEVNAKVLTESVLTAFLNEHMPTYLLDEDTDETMAENLMDLLKSEDVSNVLLGVEMLKTGGVPKKLIGELFYLQKTAGQTKVRSEIRKLMLANAPEYLLPAVNDRVGMPNPHKLKEYEIVGKLRKVEKTWTKEVCFEFCHMLYEHHKKGLRYVFKKTKPNQEWRIKAVALVYEDGFLDWTRALGYTDYSQKSIEDIDLGYSNKNTDLPTDILDSKKVTHLKLHNVKMETLSTDIAKFEDLEELDCSVNFLTKIPQDISQLSNLKRLNLSVNQFTTFPMELLNLKGLEKLDMRGNKVGYGEHAKSLQIPDEVYQALPNCEILV
ncbi:BRCT domain-containing protein [Limibacter armeniacum]|uniref:BRCT domain-containing protein n=1 Tax=Limibacter armeniacum TaxID=466084 RepID=UPI002FE61692